MEECEICNKNVPILDKHHIQSKSKSGTNKPWNIANVCQNCHRLIHLGLIILEGKFNTTNGVKIVYRKFNEPSITGMSDPEVYLLPNYMEYRDKYLKTIQR